MIPIKEGLYRHFDDSGNEYVIEADDENTALSVFNNIKAHKIYQEPEYRRQRRQAYLKELGTMEDQLDLIYWDKVNDTSTWIDKITQIKNRLPKK